ncbi:MAG: hypothetical protein U0903_10895 [Planctomycetales bacterium]
MKLVQVTMAACLAAVCVIGAVGVSKAADKPKYTISDVMKKALKGGPKSLNGKVAAGKASDDEKKLLVEMYESMAAQKPPKGSDESWKKFAGALVTAAKDAKEDKEGAAAALKKASNCTACHDAHKGEDK